MWLPLVGLLSLLAVGMRGEEYLRVPSGGRHLPKPLYKTKVLVGSEPRGRIHAKQRPPSEYLQPQPQKQAEAKPEERSLVGDEWSSGDVLESAAREGPSLTGFPRYKSASQTKNNPYIQTPILHYVHGSSPSQPPPQRHPADASGRTVLQNTQVPTQSNPTYYDPTFTDVALTYFQPSKSQDAPSEVVNVRSEATEEENEGVRVHAPSITQPLRVGDFRNGNPQGASEVTTVQPQTDYQENQSIPEFDKLNAEIRQQNKPVTSSTPVPENWSAEAAMYKFSADQDDRISDLSHLRAESRAGGVVRGLYSYSDGFFQHTVHYIADKGGYRIISDQTVPLSKQGPRTNPLGEAAVNSEVEGHRTSYRVKGEELLRSRRIWEAAQEAAANSTQLPLSRRPEA